MDQTINALLKGDKNIVTYYQKANEKWQELFVAKNDSPVSDWAQWLSDQQIEVKSMARHAATYYHLDQLPQLKKFLP